MKQSILLDGARFEVTLKRLAQQLIENHADFSNSVMVGIQPRGPFMMNRLVELIHEMSGVKIKAGALDITFHRDDFRTKGANPLQANSTTIDFLVDGKKVIFVDDVLWTGRSVRSAMDAIQSFGRPSKIELMVLVDRRFSRQIPIEPDYIGIQVDSIDAQKVIVSWANMDNEDRVELITE